MLKTRPFQPVNHLKIGVIATRFSPTDGVSLETEKWVSVLEGMGHECWFFAGECEKFSERCHFVPEAHFKHPEIEAIYLAGFTERYRRPEITRRIQALKDHLKMHLYDFIRSNGIDLLLVENALSIPMNIPLGLALTELIAETGLITIAHNHDFYWERKRFLVNCVWDYLNMAFPPNLPDIYHIVINSSAGNQLSLRTGISSRLIPNVMDFENPHTPPDGYTLDIRQDLRIEPHEKFLLQPTRVVPRKGIEHAIELARLMQIPSRLVISHASGDEGTEYEEHLRNYASLLSVEVNFVSDIIQSERGQTLDGRKIYSLWDVYPHADLVTYPSDIEGFGNAFLEALYFRRPIVVNKYSIYDIDIKPKGFWVIEFDGFITETTIEETIKVLNNPGLAEEMAEHNYHLGRRHYSYAVLERQLHDLLRECFGEK